jgi:hypothetical protein
VTRLHLRADDHWHAVRSRWLGSPPFVMPVAARYTAWLLMFGVVVATLSGDYLVGLIPHHLTLTVLSLSLALTAGAKLLKLSDDETRIHHVVLLAWRRLLELWQSRDPSSIDRAQRLEIRRAPSVD